MLTSTYSIWFSVKLFPPLHGEFEFKFISEKKKNIDIAQLHETEKN